MTTTTNAPAPPGWTDREVLQGITAILWPSEDPAIQWSSCTIAAIADLLTTTRPELLPWSMSCLVDHSWAENAAVCADERAQRAFTARYNGWASSESLEDALETLKALEDMAVKWAS
jgi:hypothetical protein